MQKPLGLKSWAVFKESSAFHFKTSWERHHMEMIRRKRTLFFFFKAAGLTLVSVNSSPEKSEHPARHKCANSVTTPK